jgi:adenylate cyclase
LLGISSIQPGGSLALVTDPDDFARRQSPLPAGPRSLDVGVTPVAAPHDRARHGGRKAARGYGLSASLSYKTAILLLAIVLMTVTVVAVVFNTHRKTTDMAVQLSGRIVSEVGEKIVTRTADLLHIAESHLVANAAVASATDLIPNQDLLANLFWQQVSFTPEIQSIYLADETGSFVQARQAPRLATRVIDRTPKPPTERWIYRDTDYRAIAHLDREVEYDPRDRPWYRGTAPQRKIYWTDVYTYESTHKPGITASYPVIGANGRIEAVLGADISLEDLSGFLSKQEIGRHSTALVIDGKGRIVAHPNQLDLNRGRPDSEGLIPVTDTGLPWIADAYRAIRAGTGATGNRDEGRHYLSSTDGNNYVSRIIGFGDRFGLPWSLAIIVGEADILTAANRALSESIVLSAIILVVSLVIAYYVALQFSEPVRQLAANTRLIRDFRFAEVTDVRSGFREIHDMNEAIGCMKDGLKVLESHLPPEVARHVMHGHEPEDLQARLMELPVLCSVVHNLGLLYNAESPDAVTSLLAAQVERGSGIVKREKGTLDTFNGDILSAFWGAPSPVEHAAYHACRAALACSTCMDSANRWAPRPGRIERHIGIDLGRALVGNVGTAGHIRYTAVGRPIEVASRLRDLNAIYGTRVIVSDAIHRDVQAHFHFRILDAIKIANGARGIRIYELICEKAASVPSGDLEFFRGCELAFEAYRNKRWSEAIALWQEARKYRPGDPAIRLLIDRCREFEAGRGSVALLPADWDGSMPCPALPVFA